MTRQIRVRKASVGIASQMQKSRFM